MAEAENNQSSSASDGQSQAQAAAGSSAASGQQSQADPPKRPEAFADKAFDSYFDPVKGVKFDDLAKTVTDLTAFKAQQDLKLAGVPAKPEEYKLALPQTFEFPKGPDGKPVEYTFDETDPRLAPVRALAHKLSLDQAGFSELLAINAQYEIGEAQQIAIARKQEIDKLGANGPARVDAVGTFLKAKLGSERGEAILNRLVLATDLEAMESLVKAFSSQGGGSYSQSHRETPSKELSEEEYQRMTPSERLAHTRKFESQRANGHAR